MIVAMYLRKSRAEENGIDIAETLRNHKEILLNFAQNNNITVKKIYEEVVSGENLCSRPQMLRMLSDIENNCYDAVLCMDIDRLGRGAMSDQGIILETLKMSDTKIITPTKTYNLNNEFDEEYTEFESFIARRELKMINRRMRRGIKKSVEEGAYLSNAPYGYKSATINKRPALAINEDEAYFVRLIFDLYVNKNKGCKIIADTINSMGARPHRSNKFCRNSIMNILRNSVYIGNIVWGKNKDTITVQGLHPAIICREIFDKAQEILNKKYHPPYYDGKIKNMLCGVIKCKLCGTTLQRRAYSHNNCVQLLCPTKKCVRSTGISYVEYHIDKIVCLVLEAIKFSIKVDNEANDDINNKLLLLKNQKGKLLSQIERIQELLETGVYDVKTYSKRYNDINCQLASLNQTYEDLTGIMDKNKSSDIPKVKNARDVFMISDISSKNIILKNALVSVYYYKAKDWEPNQFELLVEIIDVGV